MNEPFFQDWLEYEPHGFQLNQKHEIFLSAMKQLTEWHITNCSEYKQVLKTLDVDTKKIENCDLSYYSENREGNEKKEMKIKFTIYFNAAGVLLIGEADRRARPFLARTN